ncbi:hypothetical protein [Neobacillus terrae]|uniref:hypothetical protein n=1 Tax=Neobacillus terrae TaxID=3034837 RepID=UPI00140E2E6C|nr:hypothetical protein [Neobacillus terrae]NHM29987.1 hypothetical protein [Neobacillus terrae]
MNKFERILMTVFLVELFVGGGGRLIDFGILSIRQVLFLGLILALVWRIIKHKSYLDKNINTFIRFTPVTIGIYILLFWFVISAIIGLINGHAISVIATDFFRVSFFLVYFPLAYYIADERFSKTRIIKILKYSALAVAIFTIVVSLLGKTIFSSNFEPFYHFMNKVMNHDLFFRPSNSVFYKSHLFVLIGLIISLNDVLNKKFSKLDVLLVIFGSISVLWSETRGFLLAFMLSMLMIILLDGKVISDSVKGISNKFNRIIHSKKYLKKAAILLVILIAVPFLFKYMTLERFQEEVVVQQPAGQGDPTNQQEAKVKKEVNDVSVNERVKFIVGSKDILLKSPQNFVVGSGYGTEIAGRIDGIEMSFLDILVEQGLIGLGIWVFLFMIVFYNYYIAYKRDKKVDHLEISLMAAFMGVLLLTNINPFINNPIGISFFLVLLILSQRRKDSSLIEG